MPGDDFFAKFYSMKSYDFVFHFLTSFIAINIRAINLSFILQIGSVVYVVSI